MTEGGLFICECPGMNIWDDEWGEQTGERLWQIHDVEEEG
jgi:hypothetical protein